MIDISNYTKLLKECGLEFITGVPDTLLNDFCIHIEQTWHKGKHIIAANEGNAIALAAGYHLATNSIPLVYMQNSGIGNTVNPLVSLTHQEAYGIPMVLLIGWRGEPGSGDHPQHKKQGQLTSVFMEDMDIPYRVLSKNECDTSNNVKWAFNTARKNSGPVALLVPKGILEKGEKDQFDPVPSLLSREEAIKSIVESLPENTIYVASTGRATRELFEIRRLMGRSTEHDFLNVGAMGHTSSIAAGIAIGNAQRQVVCLDGDAAAIMHMGAMGVIGQTGGCKNLIHVVLNNGVHESVGGQESIGQKIKLLKVAKNLGYLVPGGVFEKREEIQAYLSQYKASDISAPLFIEIKIRKGMRSDMPVLRFDLHSQKNMLKTNLDKK